MTRPDNQLILAALAAIDRENALADQRLRQDHRNSERIAQWRYRAMETLGLWPDGTALSRQLWRKLALAHDWNYW